jgi:polyisoprenoid-binding protein YceI
MKRGKLTLAGMRLVVLCLLTFAVLPSVSRAQEAPVFAISRADSSIAFAVKASVAIQGTFDRWDATLTFTSPDVTTGVLDIKIQAATVDTGSCLKNGKLKGPDFFDVDENAFDRKNYGMNSGIPFIRIADRVEVTVALKGKRVSGPPLVFKQ